MAEAAWMPSDSVLEDLAMSLRTTDAAGYTTWFDAVEHELVSLTFHPEDAIEAPPESAPTWQHEEYALAQRVRAEPERYRYVPARGAPSRLHDFIRSITDPELADALWQAIRGGRGAYRRARDVLHRRGIEQLWYDFEAAADRELALDWLRREGLAPDAPE